MMTKSKQKLLEGFTVAVLDGELSKLVTAMLETDDSFYRFQTTANLI